MHPLEQPLDFPERVRRKRSSSIDNCFLKASSSSSSSNNNNTAYSALLALLPPQERLDFANKSLPHHERRLSLDGSGDLSKTTTFLADSSSSTLAKMKQPRDSLDADRHAEQHDDDSSCSSSASSLDSMDDAQWIMNNTFNNDDSDYEDSASFCDASMGEEGHHSYTSQDLGASIQFMTDMDGFL